MQTVTLPNIDQLVATANLKPDLPSLVHGIVSLVHGIVSLVHGIVSLDPVQVQCDGCGHIHEGERIGRIVIESVIVFGGPDGDDRRLCFDHRLKAGWRLASIESGSRTPHSRETSRPHSCAPSTSPSPATSNSRVAEINQVARIERERMHDI